MPGLLGKKLLTLAALLIVHAALALGLAAQGDSPDAPSRARHWPAIHVFAKAEPGPFGWPICVLRKDTPVLSCKWPDLAPGARITELRIAVARGSNDDAIVHASLAESGRELGSFDLRKPTEFQNHSLPLTPEQAAAVAREGVTLTLARGNELALFLPGEKTPPQWAPHLLQPGSAARETEFLARLGSLASIQTFGWMEGCVLDGLLDLGAYPEHREFITVAREHFELFKEGNRLVYITPQGKKTSDKPYGIEGFLPFGALARLQPDHPFIDTALQSAHGWLKPDGVMRHAVMTTEGTYTVGAALAEIARARKDEELMRLAIRHTAVSQQMLFTGGACYRTRNADGGLGFRNWSRGVAWQILGVARVLAIAGPREDTRELAASFRQMADWLVSLQRDDGLWGVFVDEPALKADTAGSAGIAAALAIGARAGFLDASHCDVARRTLAGLTPYLTVDGYLEGVSQSNKGGLELQRGDYRCNFPMAMGLKAQLMAALAD